MLPSKGYFKLINCPFYSSNLCHRNYCHFRHCKKETTISSGANVISTVNSDSKQTNSNLVRQVFLHEPEKNSHQNETRCTKNEPFTKSSDICKQSFLHTSSLPSNIPYYNPTPISELKTRFKHGLNKKENSLEFKHFDQDEKIKYSFKSTQTIESKIHEDCECTHNFIDELNNSINLENTVQISNKTDCKSPIHLSAIKSHVLQGFSSLEDKEHVKENITLVETINDCKKLKDVSTSEPRQQKNKAISVYSLNTELMECFDRFPSKTIKNKNTTNLSETNETGSSKSCYKTDNILKIECGTDDKKGILHKKSKKLNSIKQDYRHIKNNKKIKFIHKPDSSSKTLNIDNSKKENRKKHKSMKSGDHFKKYEITFNNETSENGTYFLSNSDSDIITISDSEASDECINDKFLTNETSDSIYSDLPEPKKKIRISHVTSFNKNKDCTDIVTSLQTDSKVKTKIPDPLQDDFPEPKKKVRISLTKSQNKAVSLESTEEYLLKWKMVKERVKRKSINPSGEEGYQNWSNVKISPVLNVASLLKSKKLIYSKINRWKNNH